MTLNETPVYDLKALSKKLNIGIRTLREYIKRGDARSRPATARQALVMAGVGEGRIEIVIFT